MIQERWLTREVQKLFINETHCEQECTTTASCKVAIGNTYILGDVCMVRLQLVKVIVDEQHMD